MCGILGGSKVQAPPKPEPVAPAPTVVTGDIKPSDTDSVEKQRRKKGFASTRSDMGFNTTLGTASVQNGFRQTLG